MPRVFITGANRGLGLEFTKQFSKLGWDIIATYRESKGELDALGVETYQLDLNDYSQISELGSIDAPIDLLINNAGVYGSNQSFPDVNTAAMEHTFRINCIAPLKVCEALLPALKKGQGKRIVNLTSKMGSIADNKKGGSFAYRASKAALNMVTKTLALELQASGICVVVMHPGWVVTDMGGPNALISAAESVTGMKQVIEKLTAQDTGRFFAFNGEELPW